jgi:hypothetical protein
MIIEFASLAGQLKLRERVSADARFASFLYALLGRRILEGFKSRWLMPLLCVVSLARTSPAESAEFMSDEAGARAPHYISECWICCAIRASVVARADRTAGSLAFRREFQKNVSNVLSGRHEEAVRNARWNMNDIARC